MSTVYDLLTEACAAGLLLSRRGDKLHVHTVVGQGPSKELLRRLREHRDQLLGWLALEERAEPLLLDCTRRIAAHYPKGCR